MAEKIVDRFAFIDVAAGNIPSSLLHLIHTTTPFLNDHSLPPLPPPPPPPPPPAAADDPTMLISFSMETTIQPEPEPAPTTSNVQKNKGKLPVQEQEPPVSREASKKRPEPEPEPEPALASAPRAADDLLDAIRRIFGEPDPKLGEMDILDVLATKGIHFEKPPWHRPGGYDRKPKN